MLWAIVCLAFCMFGLGVSATAQEPPIITFNVSGAAGTVAYSINPAGAITGEYWDASGVYGFVRAPGPEGAITPFNYPGSTFTLPWAINPSGEITGLYADPTVANLDHGFLWTPDGGFVTFDATGAGDGTGCCGAIIGSNGRGQGTMGEAINPGGWIGGDYVDAKNVSHTFLRAPDGEITEFAVPGASAYYGAWVDGACGINAAGTVVGAYAEAPSYVSHSYVRAPDGTITVFDVRAAGKGDGQGTYSSCINSEGAIVGSYVDPSGMSHGFLRAPDGRITKVDFPGAETPPAQGTGAEDINPAGAIVGYYVDMYSVAHGFVLSPDGKFTSFEAPGAGTGPGQGTYPISINPAGAITGYYCDATSCYGFVRLAEP